MDLKKILDYQKIDGEYLKVEKKLRDSEEAKNMALWQKSIKTTGDELVKLNRRTEECFQIFEKNALKYTELKKQIDESLELVAGVEDITEITYYQKNLEKMLAEVTAAEKDAATINAELEEIKKHAESEFKKYNKSIKEYKVSKEAFMALKESLQKEASECLKQLRDLSKEIEPKVMQSYKRVREERKKFPVLVPLNDKNCGGCGMEISGNLEEKFSGGTELAECPSCGRIIYKGV